MLSREISEVSKSRVLSLKSAVAPRLWHKKWRKSWISRISGTFVRVTLPGTKRLAARRGRAAFLLPLIVTSPESSLEFLNNKHDFYKMLTNIVKVGNIISSCKKIQKIKDFLSIFTLTKAPDNILFFYDFSIYVLENMLNSNIKKIDFWGKNILKIHSVNLDQDLDCVVLISTKDSRLADVLYNKILDAVIDRIHPKNTYKDFSNALENINAFISSWMQGRKKFHDFTQYYESMIKKHFFFLQ